MIKKNSKEGETISGLKIILRQQIELNWDECL